MMPGSLLLQRRTQLKPEMLRKPFYLIIVFSQYTIIVFIYSGAGITFPGGAPEFTTGF